MTLKKTLIIMFFLVIATSFGQPVERKNFGNNNYDEILADDFAIHSAISYCDNDINMGLWNCSYCTKFLPTFKVTGIFENLKTSVFGYAGRDNTLGYSVFVFEGSDDLKAWIYNLQIAKTEDLVEFNPSENPEYKYLGGDVPKVHVGFYKLYMSVRDQLFSLLPYLPEPLYITGHSQGAAIAQLFVVDRFQSTGNYSQLYSFGSPRVGNIEFATLVDKSTNGNHWRVTHNKDIVVHIPYRWNGFRHSGTEVWYPEKTGLIYDVCFGLDTNECSNSQLLPHSIEDHLWYLDIGMRYAC